MFITNKDRNGSAYIEFQYNDKDLKENKLLKVSNMTNFKSDSIYVYVDEIEKFLDIYEKYFNNGISPNGKNEFGQAVLHTG